MCPRNKDLEEPRGGSAPGREAGSPAPARRAALLWGGRSGARRGSTSVRGRGPGSAPASALLCESRGSRCSRRRIGLPGVEARGPPSPSRKCSGCRGPGALPRCSGPVVPGGGERPWGPRGRGDRRASAARGPRAWPRAEQGRDPDLSGMPALRLPASSLCLTPSSPPSCRLNSAVDLLGYLMINTGVGVSRFKVARGRPTAVGSWLQPQSIRKVFF